MKLLTKTIKKLEMFLFIFIMVYKILPENPLEIDCFQKYLAEKTFFIRITPFEHR